MNNVRTGFYWNAKAWDMAMVPEGGGALPPGRYRRIPTFLFLLMAPMMGALYVVFLPCVGFVMLIGHCWHGLSRGRRPIRSSPDVGRPCAPASTGDDWHT